MGLIGFRELNAPRFKGSIVLLLLVLPSAKITSWFFKGPEFSNPF
jgi:hypothetical protein